MGGQSLKTEEGTLLYNGVERYAIAIGPKLQNPNLNLKEEIVPKEMAYGTCVDISVEMNGTTFYIPAIIVDVKQHSAPTGIFQTGVPFDNGITEDTGGTGAIVEWYVEKEDRSGNNKSAGLNKFNQSSSLIIYRDEVLE